MASQQQAPQLFRSGLVAGQVIRGNGGIDYTLEVRMGAGCFGEVFRCVRKDADQLDESVSHKRAVVKVQRDPVSATREGAIMKFLALPIHQSPGSTADQPSASTEGDGEEDRHNISKFLGFFQHANLFCLMMEYMQGDLLKLLSVHLQHRLPPVMVSSVARQLLTALDWLKTKELIHADIKPENVLIDMRPNNEVRVKLADFGCTFIRPDSHLYFGLNIQPAIHRAPEIYVGAPFTDAIDMWSLGILSGQMMYGLACELFSPYSPLNTLQVWSRVCGDIPTKVLEAGKHTEKYYLKTGDDEYTLQLEPSTFRIRARAVQSGPGHPSTIPDPEFEKFFFGCLSVDPEKRLTPKDGLELPFIKQSVKSGQQV